MKLLLLGDSNSIHIIKWVIALNKKGVHIGLYSLNKVNHCHYDLLDNFQLKSLDVKKSVVKSGEGNLSKSSYLRAIPQIKTFIKSFNPDILHAHYASSYGLIGALCGFRPYIVSVWGSDVYDFPRRNFLFKSLLKFSLFRADIVLSTSKVMAIESEKYTNKQVIETPFGVDINKFKPLTIDWKNEQKIIIGTIKALDYKYGIDILIQAFARVVKALPMEVMELHIVGEGGEEAKLRSLTDKLQLTDKVKFIGRIDNNLVPQVLQTFDVYCALSRWDSESFGVAIVEAQACEVPVVVSDKGGLPEVVVNNHTGLVVPSEDIELAANALVSLIQDKSLRAKLGKSGRKRVLEKYDWEENVQHMLKSYTKVFSKKDEK